MKDLEKLAFLLKFAATLLFLFYATRDPHLDAMMAVIYMMTVWSWWMMYYSRDW